MAHTKFWCMECRDRCLTHTCNKHGSFPVFPHSAKLRVPDYKNKSRFRKFVRDVRIFFNCVSEEQLPLLNEIARELKIVGENINGRDFYRRNK